MITRGTPMTMGFPHLLGFHSPSQLTKVFFQDRLPGDEGEPLRRCGTGDGEQCEHNSHDKIDGSDCIYIYMYVYIYM